jgi:IPT/TIG domain
MTVEDQIFSNVDIVALGGDVPYVSVILPSQRIVSDGHLSIKVTSIVGKDQGKLSGIKVSKEAPHIAHSVPDNNGGTGYTAVDTDGDLVEAVPVDGRNSHTHQKNGTLVSFVWKEGNTVVGTGQATKLSLPVGHHTINLTVTDDRGNDSTVATKVNIFPQGYPVLYSMTPETGGISGSEQVTIKGSGLAKTISVQFGLVSLSGNDVFVVDDSTIQVVSPYSGIGVPVTVSVITPLSESNKLYYTYVGSTPIDFNIVKLLDFPNPTAVAFGPDMKLYVANNDGKIGKFTLNDDFTAVIDSMIASPLPNTRDILGIAFDPMDTSPNPTVYCTSSYFFHKEWRNSYGNAINGKIHAISGANLDTITDIVTGYVNNSCWSSINSMCHLLLLSFCFVNHRLPISDHDHGVRKFCMKHDTVILGSNCHLTFCRSYCNSSMVLYLGMRVKSISSPALILTEAYPVHCLHHISWMKTTFLHRPWLRILANLDSTVISHTTPK